jgi:formylglycine-generating enzyme required for sulfatase activity
VGFRLALIGSALLAAVSACGLLVSTDGLSGGPQGDGGPGQTSPGGGGGGEGGAAPSAEGGSGPENGAPPPSCAHPGDGVSNCGPKGDESCCASTVVAGGIFKRGDDGGNFGFDLDHPAQVSSFRLDRFEITVGRFRAFVAALSAGYSPVAGAGKHLHLNGGQGLSVETADGSGPAFESGWDGALTASLPRTGLAWDGALSCHPSFQTWSTSPGAKEKRPINCVDWLEVAAFCIWDGGFLPSEAELAYAGSGGDEQRVYPWSVPPSATSIDCTFLNVTGCANGGTDTADVGSYSPKGDGRWGQADLAGNLKEWVLDRRTDPYLNPCLDCAVLSGTNHAAHGAGYFNPFSGSANVNR